MNHIEMSATLEMLRDKRRMDALKDAREKAKRQLEAATKLHAAVEAVYDAKDLEKRMKPFREVEPKTDTDMLAQVESVLKTIDKATSATVIRDKTSAKSVMKLLMNIGHFLSPLIKEMKPDIHSKLVEMMKTHYKLFKERAAIIKKSVKNVGVVEVQMKDAEGYYDAMIMYKALIDQVESRVIIL